jgi:hypothetical protein
VYVSWSSSSTYGGDSGNRIFVLYWRCSLIRVSVIRGYTVLPSNEVAYGQILQMEGKTRLWRAM